MSAVQQTNTFRNGPDDEGHFGIFGGRYVAETLMPLILEVEKAYEVAQADRSFQEEMDHYLNHYVGRPSPLYLAERLTSHFGGAVISRAMNSITPAPTKSIIRLARFCRGVERSGLSLKQAPVSIRPTATVCAVRPPCIVYMAKDIERQSQTAFV